MSMIDPAPTLTPLKYGEAWWQEWRDAYACARYNFRQSNSRSDKRVLRRLYISADIAMAHYFAEEILDATCEKLDDVRRDFRERRARFRGVAGGTLKRVSARVTSVFRRKV